MSITLYPVYLFKFIRTKVGDERELAKDFSEESSWSYKSFGNSDLLQISYMNKLSESLIVNTDTRILNTRVLLCFSLDKNLEEVNRACQDSISPAVVLLKLDERFFNDHGLNSLKQISDHLRSLDNNSNRVKIFLSIGYYELIIFYDSSNLEDIFKFLKKIRKTTVADCGFPKSARIEFPSKRNLFSQTRTIPLISYKNVISIENWKRLKGYIRPIVSIKSSPGVEQFVAKSFGKTCQIMFGDNDIIGVWDTPTKLEAFTKQIILFRETAAKRGVFDTITTIIDLNCIENTSTTSTYSYDEPETFILENLLGALKQTTNVGPDRILLAEIVNLISHINAHLGNFTLTEQLYELPSSLASYLPGLYRAYLEALETGNLLATAANEQDIYLFTSQLKKAMHQQISSTTYNASHPAVTNATFSASLGHIIKAMSIIPEHLFSLISRTPPPERLIEYTNKTDEDSPGIISLIEEFGMAWRGFLVLDTEDNYRINCDAEIITFPMRDVFSVLNWVVASHEVSHGYYNRISFEDIDKDYLKKVREAVKDKKFPVNYPDTVFEYFAHWFDFKHFYNGDIELYLWSIWRTYQSLSRVYESPTEYWGRSLFVTIAAKWDKVKPVLERWNSELLDKETQAQKIQEYFVEILEEIHTKHIENYPEGYEFHLNSDEKNEVAMIVSHFRVWIPIFEDNYINTELIDMINTKYDRFDADIEGILKGHITEEPIENPYLILRTLLLKYYKTKPEKRKELINNEVTAALIVSFWNSSRIFYRKLELE
ncbi:hypothetical protein [Maridesulfovibrio bastinii]|uniref:hypothetical protein n=1 Tax=Maridesulfovibrio bastinii TaxID=47157 RepID=UPI000414B31E|nr:hypothetical protein [Maridesulfovibrio bastinii]